MQHPPLIASNANVHSVAGVPSYRSPTTYANAYPGTDAVAVQGRTDVITEETRAVVKRYVQEALGGHSRDRMDTMIAEDYVRHMPGGHRIVGRDPIGQSAAEQGWAACPDWRYEIEVLLAEGDLAAVRVSAGGTHTRQADAGPWRGLTPDGTRYTTTWTAIYRVRDDKIVEQWLDSPGLPTASEGS